MENLNKQGLNHLSTIIGYQEGDEITSIYPLSSTNGKNDLIKTHFVIIHTNKDKPVLDSVTSIFPGAEFYEKELADLLGIQYNLKNYDRFLLPDSVPQGIYPLRKDFSSSEIKSKFDSWSIGNEQPDPLKDQSDYSISVGPQHPTNKEPIRFQFFVEGEAIKDVKLRLGFNHRGIEKALEAGAYTQNLYLIERICGICSAAHQLAYVVTAEKIAGLVDEIPDRAQWIRTLIAELERIHSHMLWYGVLAHDAGFDLMFHISWRDREIVMDILEKLTGNRVNYSMQTLGGVRRDIASDMINKVISDLKILRQRVVEHKEIMEKEETFILRMSDVGILTKDQGIRMNVVGPTARASKINFDLRRDLPYVAYKEIPFQVYTRSEGDVYASLSVRMDETIEAVDMCIYILENLPKGEITTKFPNRLPTGEAHTRVEAPRGENIHFLKSDGSKTPYRHKIRAPTLANIFSLLERFKTMQVADIPLIIRLIDPCIGCMERVTFVDSTSLHHKTISGQELIHRANKSYRLNKRIDIFG